ncbi:MAG: hypothetical protein QOD66_817 [Solirubrobacteraceae bacterium]|nr:hypothetical protein [Solirubrobacteraceae bacterium]
MFAARVRIRWETWLTSAERICTREWQLGGVRFSRLVASVTVGLGLGAAAVLGTSGPVPAANRSEGKLPVAQLVALARDSLPGLNDPRVRTASVVATTKNAAENWMTPGAVPPSHPNPVAYLIVLQGRFVCTSCSFPRGAKAPRGRFSQAVWIPGQGVSDGGLTPKLPPGLSKLGQVVKLTLTAPRVPAGELALRPGVGIGPVRLGTRLRKLASEIGPALQPGRWVFGPIEADTQATPVGRVNRLAVLSPQATVDGHHLGEGYARLRQKLAGWRSLDCGSGRRILLLDNAGGVSTRLEFARDRFNLAWIGSARPGTCVPPLPSG